MTFSTNEIQTLDFNDVAGPAYNNRRGPGDESLSRDRIDDRYRAENRGRLWTTLPAGRQISVRTDDTIDSTEAAEGRTHPASIQTGVMDASGNLVRRLNEGGALNCEKET